MSLSKERNDVTMTRLAKLAALAAVGTLSLTACGGGTTVTTTAATSAATSTSTAATLACPTGKLVGGGSTAQKLAMETLTSNYAAECGNKATIEYSGTGSGAGIKDFYNGQIDFAGSDSALKSEPNKDNVIETDKVEARCSAPGWNLPLVVSPVAFAYNLTGVDALTLTPAVIADIFNGRITAWNDTAIAALNSGVTLPDTKISPFFRSDESGTSENMQKYLAASAPTNWTAEPAKTWEGFGGALFFSQLAGCGLYAAFPGQLSFFGNYGHVIALGFLLAILAVIGDLAESVVKRALNAKDSGRMLPGIGGSLDLIDSVCFTAPATFFYLKWILLPAA